MLTVMGLSAKNAILIVEFAKDKRENEGYSIADAAGAAAGENETEMHAILAEFDLPYKFEPEVEQAVGAVAGVEVEAPRARCRLL